MDAQIKQCRICMDNSLQFLSMDSCSTDYPFRTLRENFNFCTHLDAQKDDKLPDAICKACFKDLNSAVEFVQRAREADIRLRELLAPSSEPSAPMSSSTDMIEVKQEECVQFEMIEAEQSSDYEPGAEFDECSDGGIAETSNPINVGDIECSPSEEKQQPMLDEKDKRLTIIICSICGESCSECGFKSHVAKHQVAEKASIKFYQCKNGQKKLVVEGYVLHQNRVKKDICYWECKLRRKNLGGCNSRATTKFINENHQLQTHTAHNHAPLRRDVEKLERLKFKTISKKVKILKETSYRTEEYVDNVVHNYTDKQFKNEFRISKETVKFLIKDYENSEYFGNRAYRGGRLQLSGETEILSFLWFSSDKNSIREICTRFSMSLSTFHRTTNKVLDYFALGLAPRIIKMPTSFAEKAEIANKFEMIAGFPNVLGCIDVTYIKIRTPKHKTRTEYSNQNGLRTLTLQGICDADKRFLDVYTGPPSRRNDAKLFKMSAISEDIENICKPEYHLLGDVSYPLREYLLTPYYDNVDLTESEAEYNRIFGETFAENRKAFGLLKSRFQQLIRLDFHEVDTMSKFIIACCALHNFCIDRNDFWEGNTDCLEENVEEYDYRNDNASDAMMKLLGEAKRQNIATMLESI